MATESPLAALAHRARIGKFVSVGALGATIETAIVALLTTTAGFGPLAAKAVGAEVSISTMFVVNDQWTFAESGKLGVGAFARRWVRSHLVRAVGLGVGFAVLYVLTSVVEFSLPVAGLELWPTVANVIGIGVGMVFNYVAESLFTWRVD
ncbi:putative flippase GtrA [Halohasta litchfieldiae]|jgi:putative flippase GtrA|uniref:Putative flippase GtrA (Transmembrane translocase of bactoprenol-linked glucose) n=1 Tax=Halohasta litchfieldiae TaxID=1073996 RepID=A0A1H6VXI4_9EURY|nr:GtrA family protein [Halohasta litchfieldiae]ATW89418.1 putative flippase GtrA [Halohasta litchfieldiae]SEJ04902.1 Putative flippase GtrA (transmembrane translocase of bactoprenol-linked glucose) [Halohasta litchfieldiae]